MHITVDGTSLQAFTGESVAAVLMAAERREFRVTARRGQSRGLFCGMGVCYDCLVVIDGEPGRRACMTLVKDGMDVSIQHGWGDSNVSNSSSTDPAT